MCGALSGCSEYTIVPEATKPELEPSEEIFVELPRSGLSVTGAEVEVSMLLPVSPAYSRMRSRAEVALLPLRLSMSETSSLGFSGSVYCEGVEVEVGTEPLSGAGLFRSSEIGEGSGLFV